MGWTHRLVGLIADLPASTMAVLGIGGLRPCLRARTEAASAGVLRLVLIVRGVHLLTLVALALARPSRSRSSPRPESPPS